MYAIVKNSDKTYYTSAVFCHARKLNDYDSIDVFSEYYIVLNQEKNKLIKVMNQPKELRYLMPRILELDDGQTGWINTKENGYKDVVDFLADIDFESDNWVVPQDLLERCIEIDSQYDYQEIKEVKTETDIENVLCTTHYFHDGFIEDGNETEDSLYLRFSGLIGCDFDLWFSGDVEHNIDSFDPNDFDTEIFSTPYWDHVSIFFEDGYTYLVRDAATKRSEIGEYTQYVRAKSIKYRIAPIYSDGWQFIIK